MRLYTVIALTVVLSVLTSGCTENMQESAGNPYAISAKGAKGLMQLMDGTAKMLGVTDPFDIRQNIHAGVKYLSSLIKKKFN